MNISNKESPNFVRTRCLIQRYKGAERFNGQVPNGARVSMVYCAGVSGMMVEPYGRSRTSWSLLFLMKVPCALFFP